MKLSSVLNDVKDLISVSIPYHDRAIDSLQRTFHGTIVLEEGTMPLEDNLHGMYGFEK